MSQFISSRKAADAARHGVFHALQVGVLFALKDPEKAKKLLDCNSLNEMALIIDVPRDRSLTEGLLLAKEKFK